MVSSSSLDGRYTLRSVTVSTQGLGAAAATPVFFLPEVEEEVDFFDFNGVFRDRERVGRAADI